MVGKIFISYRRSDSRKDARAIYERLRREFGDNRVFIDLEGIEPGEDFVDILERNLEGCEALIVLIGRDWMGGADEGSQPRLSNENDFVRIEVSTALRRGIRIFPVLLDGALLPHAVQLPADLQPLVRRQAISLDYAKFDSDVAVLARAVKRAVEQAKADGKQQPRAKGGLDVISGPQTPDIREVVAALDLSPRPASIQKNELTPSSSKPPVAAAAISSSVSAGSASKAYRKHKPLQNKLLTAFVLLFPVVGALWKLIPDDTRDPPEQPVSAVVSSPCPSETKLINGDCVATRPSESNRAVPITGGSTSQKTDVQGNCQLGFRMISNECIPESALGAHSSVKSSAGKITPYKGPTLPSPDAMVPQKPDVRGNCQEGFKMIMNECIPGSVMGIYPSIKDSTDVVTRSRGRAGSADCPSGYKMIMNECVPESALK